MSAAAQRGLGASLGGLALAGLGALLLQDLAGFHGGARWAPSEPMCGALLGGFAAFAATALGALPAMLLRAVSQRAEDIMLGFAAGVMLAASAFSLIVPAAVAGAGMLGGRMPAALLAAAGLGAGMLLMIGIERALPHEHRHLVPAGSPSKLARV